jgi:hypothetical protein
MLSGTIGPRADPLHTSLFDLKPHQLDDQTESCRTTGLKEMGNTMKNLIVVICLMGFSVLALAQEKTPPKVAPADAKNHVGEMATVCGKVVDNKVGKYGIAGHGKPVTFHLDQPEPNTVFYFVTFGGEQPGGPDEVVSAYKDKRVCVTGKITTTSTGPFIMAADRTQIKTQPEDK